MKTQARDESQREGANQSCKVQLQILKPFKDLHLKSEILKVKKNIFYTNNSMLHLLYQKYV